MEAWKGSLILSDGHSISDIHIGAASVKTAILPSTARLRFLAFVDPTRIPIYLIHGPRLDVWTHTEETESWFSKTLLNVNSEEGEAEWWHTARPESPLGVLAAVDTVSIQETSRGTPRITEVLFLASRSSDMPPCPPTPPHSSQGTADLAAATSDPVLNLHAFTLSSDLTHNGLAHISPPASPTTTETDTISATFLPDPFATEQLHSAPPKPIATTLKRKSVHDTFTEAESLRKRVRQRPGESVQAASAHPPSMPSLKQMTSNSFHSQNSSFTRPASASGNVPMQTRPLSRSPSISSAKAASTTKSTADPPKRSSLARVQSVAITTIDTDEPKDAQIEAKNKDLLSRLVMAGMRLHGLSQSKSKSTKPHPSQSQPQRRSSLAHSVLATNQESPNPTTTTDEQKKKSDEEYKLIYHQTVRGATFAFRTHISSAPLHPHTETLREVVDKLLVLYCGDPLANGLASGDAVPGSERITPGGRKVFETPAEEVEDSPFALGGVGGAGRGKEGGKGVGQGEEAITPSFRKRGKLEVKEKEKEMEN